MPKVSSKVRLANNELVQLVREGDSARAVTKANQVINDLGEHPTLLYTRGIAKMNLRKFSDALEDFTSVIKQEEDASPNLRCDCLINRGAVYKIEEKYDQALKDYNTALDLVKQNKLGQEKASILYMNKGQLYDRMKLPQKAVVEYTEYINTKGYLTPVATNNRGLSYLDMDEYDRAAKDFDQAIKLEPKNALFVYNRGICYEAVNDSAGALRCYREATELDPNERTYQHKLNQLLYATKNSNNEHEGSLSSATDDAAPLLAAKHLKTIAEKEASRSKSKKKSKKTKLKKKSK
mmetsp:Transcript_10846/g.18129  ORF Transcript_10846/g.18129 Transcript_10846/m.18129 type:complete len:293 (-) Transcript_10846:41-919(-)